MSVALTVKIQNVGTDEYVPIAAERTYAELWVPAARSLKLAWLEQFRDGVFVPLAVLPEVVKEFEAVRVHFSNTGNESNALRASSAIEALERVIRSGAFTEVFVG